MVIDTSALAAIVFGEPEAEYFLDRIAGDPLRLLSAVSRLETGMIVEARKGTLAGHEFALLMDRLGITVVPFDQQQSELALHAWRRYGKGNHPAGLNFGDCCSYALAKVRCQDLLYKGEDFTRTDLATPPVARASL